MLKDQIFQIVARLRLQAITLNDQAEKLEAIAAAMDQPELSFDTSKEDCPECGIAAGLHIAFCPNSKPDDGQ